MRWVLAVVVVALVACNEPPATNETACANVCSCTVDPFARHDCNRQCPTLLEMFQPPQACLDCLADAVCTDLENGCDAACNAFAQELP